MARTIKGIALEDIFFELRKKKDPDDYLEGKYPYYKYSSYYRLAEETLGLDHYSLECIDSRECTLSSGQEAVMACCRMTLLDDDYNPICHRDGWGTSEILYNKQGKRTGLKNDISNAYKAAFKACMDAFGAFGKASVEEESERPKKQTEKPKNTMSNNTPATSGNNKNITLATTGKPIVEREDRQTGKPVFVIPVGLVSNNQMTDIKGKLVCYPNQYNQCLEKFNSLLSILEERNVTANVVVLEKGTDGDISYIFKGFWK